MNKKTILGLLLIANLYGEMASANEVTISAQRLQSISKVELTIMQNQGAITRQGDRVILNLQKLDTMLKDKKTAYDLSKAAGLNNARTVPYGYTPVEPWEKSKLDSAKISEALNARFIPYGYT